MRRDPYRITVQELAVAKIIYWASEAHLLARRAAYRLGIGACPGCPRRRGQGHKMDCGWAQ